MLKIAAVFHHEQLLSETPADLRAELQALTGQAFRRINRFIELAIFGALQCGRSAGGVGADTAMYLASEAPMLVDCVRALRGVVAEGRPPKPFEFMNISGNMAGFYIAQHLRMCGPQLATHRKGAALEAVCELLQLGSAHHRRALLGYVEEGVWPLAEQRVRLNLPENAPILECSHWFYFDADHPQPKALLEVARRCAGLDEAANVLRKIPSGWRIVAGHGCGADEIERLAAAGVAASGLPAERPYSTGETAGLLASFVKRPDAPGLAHLSRGGDGGYYPVLVRAA